MDPEEIAKELDKALQPFIGKYEITQDTLDEVRKAIELEFPKPEYSVSVRQHSLMKDRLTIHVITQSLEDYRITV